MVLIQDGIRKDRRTAMWHIELLGGVKVSSGDQVVSHFESRKAVSLLAYLAHHPDRSHPRELLAEMLWPDEDPAATRDRLRQALASIRRLLEPTESSSQSILFADRSEVGLCAGAISTDVERFDRLIQKASKESDPEQRLACLREAVQICRGEFMPGYYDPWIATERDRLAERLYICLCEASELSAELEKGAAAEEYAKRALRLDPLREEGYAALIRFYHAQGRIGDGIRKYRDLERILRDELGVAPSESTRALAGRLYDPSSDSVNASSGVTQFPAGACPGEADGGAVPLNSPYYLVRPTDEEFHQAILRNDSIVLLKGARQIGKTSLLARGLHRARQRGTPVILTDIQKLTDQQLHSPEALFRTLAESIDDQLELESGIALDWNADRGWNVNFERFMRRHVLADRDTPLLWCLDEVDLLFGYPYSKSLFGLFRAWHNERSLDPEGPWSRLTLAIAYATEAHLFISDLNQSPFNVGTRLALSDFTPGEVAEINRRYGSPLNGEKQIREFVDLVGGHPYLVRRGLHTLASSGEPLERFLALASREDSVFGDHLSRMYGALRSDSLLCDAMREVLQGRPCPSPESFYRLQSAGLITGESEVEARPRCRLYRAFLERRLI